MKVRHSLGLGVKQHPRRWLPKRQERISCTQVAEPGGLRPGTVCGLQGALRAENPVQVPRGHMECGSASDVGLSKGQVQGKGLQVIPRGGVWIQTSHWGHGQNRSQAAWLPSQRQSQHGCFLQLQPLLLWLSSESA